MQCLAEGDFQLSVACPGLAFSFDAPTPYYVYRWLMGSRDVKPRGHVERRFRTVPIGSKTTIVTLPIPRVECPACGVVRQVEVSFADPRRSYTKAFQRYALELSRRSCKPGG